jgi:hypothetical protein
LLSYGTVGASMAMLIFFAATARAGIVTANFPIHRLNRSPRFPSRQVGAHLTHRARPLNPDLNRPEYAIDDVVLDGCQEVLIHLVGLFFIGYQGVLLPVGPQANALPQVSQVGKVTDPKVVNHLQHNLAVVLHGQNLAESLLHPLTGISVQRR